MGGVNRYFACSKISAARFRHLVRCFALDLTATQTAAVTGISVRSVNAIFLRIRVRMAEACERDSPFQGEVEADESNPEPTRWKWSITSRRCCRNSAPRFRLP